MGQIDLPEDLAGCGTVIRKHARPCVKFSLAPGEPGPGASRLGGGADLAAGLAWPTAKGRKLDFLLQVALGDLSGFPGSEGLPRHGLLSFFYDLENQPWGFDPKDLDGFRVLYSPTNTVLEPHPATGLAPHALAFRPEVSFPSFGSRDYDRLEREAGMDDAQKDAYLDFVARVTPGPEHRLMGHSANLQGDMQLEAQLVSHGLYCGDASGYRDPRAASLEAGADDWVLLLQLDSDEDGGFMWGDAGLLYFWIRRQDLAQRRFDRAWAALQCC